MKTLISEVEFTPIRGKNGFLGFASLVFNNHMFLANIGVYTRPEGTLFRCVYPSKKLPNGQHIDFYYPISKETGNLIEQEVSEKIESIYSTISNY